jgi:hypothetical protein
MQLIAVLVGLGVATFLASWFMWWAAKRGTWFAMLAGGLLAIVLSIGIAILAALMTRVG